MKSPFSKLQLLFALLLSLTIVITSCGPSEEDVQQDEVAVSMDADGASVITPVCQGAYYCVKTDGTNAYWYVYGTYYTAARQSLACNNAIASGYCTPPVGATGCAFDRNKFPPAPRPCMVK